jgi:hypothetical protein
MLLIGPDNSVSFLWNKTGKELKKIILEIHTKTFYNAYTQSYI